MSPLRWLFVGFSLLSTVGFAEVSKVDRLYHVYFDRVASATYSSSAGNGIAGMLNTGVSGAPEYVEYGVVNGNFAITGSGEVTYQALEGTKAVVKREKFARVHLIFERRNEMAPKPITKNNATDQIIATSNGGTLVYSRFLAGCNIMAQNVLANRGIPEGKFQVSAPTDTNPYAAQIVQVAGQKEFRVFYRNTVTPNNVLFGSFRCNEWLSKPR